MLVLLLQHFDGKIRPKRTKMDKHGQNKTVTPPTTPPADTYTLLKRYAGPEVPS